MLTLPVLFNHQREVEDSSRQVVHPLGGWLRIKWIRMNSAWRKLLLFILSRDSGVTSSVVDSASWRTEIIWQNPACDTCLFKPGVCGMVRNKTDFFNAHLWMNLKKLSVFAKAHENLLSGTGNETTFYFSFHVFCHYILHGGPQFPKYWDLTPCLGHALLAGWQITMIRSVNSYFITMWV